MLKETKEISRYHISLFASTGHAVLPAFAIDISFERGRSYGVDEGLSTHKFQIRRVRKKNEKSLFFKKTDEEACVKEKNGSMFSSC